MTLHPNGHNRRGRRWLPFVVVVTVLLLGLAMLIWGSQLLSTEDTATSNTGLIQRLEETIQHVNRVSKRTDREITASRIESVYQSCLQFNDNQGALTRVIEATYRPQLDPRLRRAFQREVRKLRPNDCGTQKCLLTRAIASRGFEHVAVPYQHTYPNARRAHC